MKRKLEEKELPYLKDPEPIWKNRQIFIYYFNRINLLNKYLLFNILKVIEI